MWPWKKSGQQSEQPGGRTAGPDGSDGMAEETQHPEMADHADDMDGGGELQSRIGQLEAELEDARNKTLRLHADFQNYQRRALQNEVVAKQQGIGTLASSVVTVLDHFDTALAQTTGSGTVEQVLEGLRLIRDELLKALNQHGVSVLNPQPGDLFEPGKHEAVMQQAAQGVEPGHVVSTFQAGYTLAGSGGVPERVLRPAKVVVAPTE
jgi:molecular chaperone GrpE